MISSITFPENGDGYIYRKPQKPIKPIKDFVHYSKRENEDDWMSRTIFDEESYNRDLTAYKEEMKVYNKTKNDYILPCSKLLINKTFNFERDKVNLIFGPNGCGKSTILRAIAGTALTQDGFTTLYGPLEFPYVKNNKNRYVIDSLISKISGNSANVDWDGAPIYYHNFSAKEQNYCIIGQMVGSVLGTFEDEIGYIANRNKTSSGQKSMFFINKLIEIAKQKISLNNLVDRYNINNVNDSWKKCYMSQIEYLKQYPKYDVEEPITMLFDEIDKSLDIETVWKLFTKVLPRMIESTGVQIIIVSHNPLVLTKEIFDNPTYNIVSVDQEYTDEMKKMLSNTSF